MQWLSLSLCESGAKYYLEETSCTCFPKWMSPSNNTNLCLVQVQVQWIQVFLVFPFCQGYYRNHLERKQPRLAVRRFSCILRRSDIYIWQPGWQLHFALWSQTVLNPQAHTLHRFNIDLYRIYEYVSIYHIVLSFWHKLFHFCSRMYACRHSWYSVGNGQFGLEGSEFLRLLGGSRHPFEQGCVRPAPSLKSGDDWMIDVFLGWFFEVENS